MGRVIPFDPLDKMNLAHSVGNALENEKPRRLDELEKFEGSGVYALYYTGDFPAYRLIAQMNQEACLVPIYVGKADSRGKRKGGFIEDSSTGCALYNRLKDHSKSIDQARNLRLEDFWYRRLVVDDLWISLGESLLISRHAPVWNTLVEGFGNHDPGKGRINGKRPLWDMLHPGRSWADKYPENDISAAMIESQAIQYLNERLCGAADF